MTTTVKLTSSLATTVALVYQTANTAIEYARSIVADPGCPGPVKGTMLNVITDLQITTSKIEKRVPVASRDEFKDHYKDNDLLRLENIKRLYMRLSKDQQDSLEAMIELLDKGETIQIQTQN